MAINDLTKKRCLPCEGIGQAMHHQEVIQVLPALEGWHMAQDEKSISRDFIFKNFVEAVHAVNAIKDVAEADNHHPDLHLTQYKKLKVVLSTHALGGITENDLILAAKINALGLLKAAKEG